ncbi:hypothetical protein N7488_011040 [Penicillium malachiteum]|nr:hypothetical protein N7488_011040 [Penicillium malachiteum]
MFALITGCSSGIGKELAIAFAVKGVTVLATARRTGSLDDLTSRYNNIESFPLDLDVPDSVEELKDAVMKRTDGRLDFLVNNARTHYASTRVDLEIEEVVKLFQVNVFAVMRLCQVFVPLLCQAPRARIVQIGSVTRSIPVVWQGPYNASKAALSQYSKTLRLELMPLGIEVVEIVTGVENIKYEGNKNDMPTQTYAISVVAKLMQPRINPEIWEGALVRSLRFFATVLPLKVLNWFLFRRFKLDLIKRCDYIRLLL